jgi:glycosyltransferase involved in cell wall biosynthesis
VPPSSRQPLRVALVTERLPATDHAEITGGVEGRCYYVGHELERAASVLYVADRTSGKRWAPASLRTIPERVSFVARSFVTLMRADVDVIDASNQVVYLGSWLAAKLKRVPCVFFVPDVLSGTNAVRQMGLAGRLFSMAEWVSLRLPVDRYIAPAQPTRDRLVARGVDANRIDLIPCGYDEAMSNRIVAERDQQIAPAPDLVVVSRLVEYKRVDVVIRAVAGLVAVVPGVRLRIVGQGPQRSSLERLAKSLGIGDRVTFDGFVEHHEDVLCLIARSRCLVSASEVEGFGIVLVEAMSVGTPVVVSDIPAYREVTAGGTSGALFPPGKVEDLVAILRPLLVDDRLWLESSHSSKIHARRYTWSGIAASTLETYHRACCVLADA